MKQQAESLTVQKGMRVPRAFTKEGLSPFDQFTYEKRTSTIKNPDGSIVFHMDEVEVPSSWTQVATDILAQKYFRKAGVPLREVRNVRNEPGELLRDENGRIITGSETSIKQVAHRIAGCWRSWGEQYGYFASPEDAQIFYEEMVYMIIAQVAAPNSPQWFTTGLNWAYGINGPAQGHSYVDPVTKKLEYSKDAYSRSQPHACFIQSIRDDLVTDGGIFSLLTREARVFKYGSGCTGARSYVWTTFCGLEQMEKLWSRMVEMKYPVHADGEYASYIEPKEPIYTLALQQDGAFVKDKINQLWRFNIKPADKLRIKTTYGAEALVSSWHPGMILEQGNIVERRTDELKRGDLLVTPNKTVEKSWPWQDNHLLSYNYEHFGKIKEATLEVNPEIGWLVGYFIGDGSIGYGNYQRQRTGTRKLRVRFYDETRENLERVQDIMQRRFGLRASIRPNAPKKSKALELTITQEKAAGFFHHFCPAGSKTYSVQLPSWIFKSPVTVFRAVVAGLLDSDGTISADNDTVRAMFSTASPKLAEQLQALVSYFGWTTTQISVKLSTDRTQAITILARNTSVKIKQAIAAYMSHPTRREHLSAVKVKESKTGAWRRDGVSWTGLGLDKIIADKNLKHFRVDFPSSLRYIIDGKKFYLAPARSQDRIGKGRAGSFLSAVLPYLTTENKLLAERLLRILEGVTEVSAVESAESDTTPFYDFTMANYHNYLAGERGMLTIHNTGSNFSNLRGKGERLSGGGTSSGLMSFLKIFDTAAGSVKSGGTTRRAAKMVCLDMDHPEIENFIWWKVREEEKVASLVAGSKILKHRLDKLVEAAKNHPSPLEDKSIRKLIKQAAQQNIPLNYIVRAIDLARQGHHFPLREFDTHYESEAYQTVSGQNSNNSIRIPNSFFEALHTGRDWQLKSRTSGEIFKTISTKKLWDDVAYCAWASADPGVQFDSTINEWHTCPVDGRINASNPCGEFNFLDDTACNLASINLMKFFDDVTGTFNIQQYRHTIRLWTIALEISVLMAQFPSEEIARKSYLYRTLGLGFANLGTLLMVQGIPYDSERGRAIGGALAAIMTGDTYATSAELASVLGAFERYEANKEAMLRVMRNHRRAAYDEERYEELTIKPYAINQELCPPNLLRAGQDAWDKALEWGEQHGYRNAQASVIAPTGCLVGNSLVATEQGLVKLNTLGNVQGTQWQDVSFQVLTDEGPRQATKFFINGLAETRNIVTAAGYEIQGTPSHQIKVLDAEGNLVWKTLAGVKAGDIVPIAMQQTLGKPQLVILPPLPELHWNADYDTIVPSEATPLLAELVGYFMGDGSLHSKGLRFCVTNGDDDVIQRLTANIKQLFNLNAKISQQEGYVEVTAQSVPLAVWWDAAGFSKLKPSPEHSGKGYSPRIPDALLYTNNVEVYQAFLRGLFEADGTVTSGIPTWCTANKEFAQEIKTLMLSIGYPTTTRINISGWGQSEIYVQRLRNASYNEKFRKEIGFIGGRKLGKIILSTTYQGGKKDPIYFSLPLQQEFLNIAGEYKRAMRQSLQSGGTVSRQAVEAIYVQSQNPQLRQALQFFYDRVEKNEDGGKQLTYDLSVPENVTYIANGFISHNTIGLVMSCDTTGVEPDYSIVKFKKLAGGGYFKIINDSVPLALRRLDYSENQIKEITNYCLGQPTFQNSPYINRESLKEQGFSEEQLTSIEKQLSSAMDIRFVFNQYTLGDDFYHKLMSKAKGRGSKPVSSDSSTSPGDLLSALGFTEEQINAANEYICGTMTLEGAPHLKEEHYPIFDCANRCGKKGQRYIHPYGHLKMLAAVQSFISGAISKTINMPPYWTVQQIQKAYYDAWTMMIKAVALYRDGSKLSQPLNATLEQNPELKAVLETALEEAREEEKGQSSPIEVHRKVLLGQRELHLSGIEENGRLLKVQAVMPSMSPAQESMLIALVNMVNVGLSSGMNVAMLSQNLAVEGHPVVQELRNFLQQYERKSSTTVHPTTVIAHQTAVPSLPGTIASITTNLITPHLERKTTVTTADSQSEKVKCSGCGATQLRPNGSCLLCEVCGETSGCS